MIWQHRNEQGQVIGEIHRILKDSGKVDIPHYKESAWGWGSGIPEHKKPLPPFGVDSITNWQTPIIVAEGQKCCVAWQEIGYQCVSGVCGASYAKRMDWSCFAKGFEVWLSPDNDAPGYRYIADVTKEILKHNPNIHFKLIVLPNLPPKGDIVDYLKLVDSKVLSSPKWPPRISYNPEFPPPPPHKVAQKKSSYNANMKASVDLLDTANQLTNLTKFSGGWKGRCPFHQDKVDSFTITRNGRYWKCWAGCGEGSVIDLIMVRDGVGFKQAVKQVRRGA